MSAIVAGVRFVEPLEREVVRVGKLLDGLGPSDWERPTRCPPMTVLDLAAHAWRGGIRINEMLDAGAIDDEPEKDGATYFQYDPVAIAPGVVERARAVARDLDPATFPRVWLTGWRESLGRARDVLEKDPVLPGVFGTIRLSEYLRTRIVEVTVHAMDLRDALGLAPDPDPTALEATAGVLRALLGTDLRAHGMDDVRFVLVGTGRGGLDDAERTYLGPLVERFPLLA